MTVPEGHFRMYPSMAPPLKAGGYRFVPIDYVPYK